MNTGIAMIDILPLWLWALVATLFGLTIGSFINVVIYRVPREQSIVFPRSACPNCGHMITAWENIPVFSYLVLGGKCRGCSNPISLVYPLVETLIAASFVLVFLKHASATEFSFLAVIADAVFISACIALVFIDYEHMILPNIITLPGTLAAFIVRLFIPNTVGPESTFFAAQFALIVLVMYALFWALGKWGRSNLFRLIMLTLLAVLIFIIVSLSFSAVDLYIDFQINFIFYWKENIEPHPSIVSLINGLIGALIGSGLLLMLREAYLTLRDKEAMGLGDVKMMLMVGAFLGWQLSVAVLVLASFLGTVVAIPLFLRKGREALSSKIPFGIFLGGAAVILTLYGDDIVGWYVQTMVYR